MNETGTITRQRYITAKRAARIASEWYNGDASALYKFACKPDGNFKGLTANDYAEAYTETAKEVTRGIFNHEPESVRGSLNALTAFLIHRCPQKEDHIMTTAILDQCSWNDGYRAAMADVLRRH